MRAPAAGQQRTDTPPYSSTSGVSHLSRKCATVFTDAYVRRLAALTPRISLRANAPPPLTRVDCV
ncbi:hypothetical protein H9L13_12530 [Sphingomonas lutea]|uniref:Uncharacterized protein n=1 Tax=Sphingomonas lutea TaxID=1045317 RepID=A0A7G9SHS1_9SPHN|nr:hypothetical protein [Sphingomonas lutea]QNN67396.1 hypothetical protein H9L13_12530 [Sphingomonas lutea]